jgi:hypothetical protein
MPVIFQQDDTPPHFSIKVQNAFQATELEDDVLLCGSLQVLIQASYICFFEEKFC